MWYRSCVALVATLIIVVSFSHRASAQDNPVVVMETSHGTVAIELFAAKAPISVENFLAYVDDEHYDGTIFHRVIQDFMIQGGQNVLKSSRPPIKNEAENGLTNDHYTVAMARTNEVDSATDQFFINTKDNAFLNNGARDFGYAVFGNVIEGTDVVDSIAATPAPGTAPTTPVVIQSIRRR